VGDRIRVIQHATGRLVDSDLRITRLEKRAGTTRLQLSEAVAGDVVTLAGAGDAAGIADTIAAPGVEQGLDPGPIDPPTLRCDLVVTLACMGPSVVCWLACCGRVRWRGCLQMGQLGMLQPL
jgi:predicted membrane GTPase involved in stress response